MQIAVWMSWAAFSISYSGESYRLIQVKNNKKTQQKNTISHRQSFSCPHSITVTTMTYEDHEQWLVRVILVELPVSWSRHVKNVWHYDCLIWHDDHRGRPKYHDCVVCIIQQKEDAVHLLSSSFYSIMRAWLKQCTLFPWTVNFSQHEVRLSQRSHNEV